MVNVLECPSYSPITALKLQPTHYNKQSMTQSRLVLLYIQKLRKSAKSVLSYLHLYIQGLEGAACESIKKVTCRDR